MYKKQVAFQRIVCFAALITGALVFIYALGVLTDLYDTLYIMVEPTKLDSPKVAGARIYYDMQPFNQLLLTSSICLILLACFLFLTNTHVRRKYYVGNAVATCLNAIAELGVAVWIHVQMQQFKQTYLTTVDFEALEKQLTMRKREFTNSTFWFDIHYLVSALLILSAVLLIVNFVWKKKMMREEQSLLTSSAKVTGKAVSA